MLLLTGLPYIHHEVGCFGLKISGLNIQWSIAEFVCLQVILYILKNLLYFTFCYCIFDVQQYLVSPWQLSASLFHFPGNFFSFLLMLEYYSFNKLVTKLISLPISFFKWLIASEYRVLLDAVFICKHTYIRIHVLHLTDKFEKRGEQTLYIKPFRPSFLQNAFSHGLFHICIHLNHTSIM